MFFPLLHHCPLFVFSPSCLRSLQFFLWVKFDWIALNTGSRESVESFQQMSVFRLGGWFSVRSAVDYSCCVICGLWALSSGKRYMAIHLLQAVHNSWLDWHAVLHPLSLSTLNETQSGSVFRFLCPFSTLHLSWYKRLNAHWNFMNVCLILYSMFLSVCVHFPSHCVKMCDLKSSQVKFI